VIFAAPPVDDALARSLRELDDLRARLGDRVGVAGPWLGGLRRQWRARSAATSVEIEGFHVPAHETLAIAGGQEQPDPRDEDQMALACYARAMDHVGVMAHDPSFAWVERVILDLHFDACWFQNDKDPGRYRRGPIAVSDPRDSSAAAYHGPPAEEVPALMSEVVDWLDRDDRDAHVVVQAAMAHLHLVSVHPFSDGNGRVSRILQSLVLARGGLLMPELLSIEEHLGRNTAAYYAVLEEVQGGRYQPERDASPWVRFCVQAHLDQGGRRLEQLVAAGRRWSQLERLIAARGWPDRLVIALEQSLFDGVDRASYIAEAEVAAPTASNDLRRLLDARLIIRQGSGRNTRYIAAEALRAEIGAT
jgi:Fic family protein